MNGYKAWIVVDPTDDDAVYAHAAEGRVDVLAVFETRAKARQWVRETPPHDFPTKIMRAQITACGQKEKP